MGLNVPGCGPQLRKLPSLVGSDAAELSEYLPPLESRVRVRRQVEEALAEMEASSEPVVVLLIAEWGEGKTSIYNALIRPEAEKRGWSTLEARTASLIAHLRSLGKRIEKSPAHRFLAALLAASLEQANMLRYYGVPESASSLRDYVIGVLSKLAQNSRLIIFLDEFEDVVTIRDTELVGEVVAGMLGLINGDVEELSAKCRGNHCLSGRLHLVISLTPPAYTRLMSLRDFATIAARLKRRIRTIWIPPLTHAESLVFAEALSKYSLGAGLESLLDPPSLSNALIQASLGNLGALVSLYRYIASRAWELGRDRCGGVQQLGPEELVAELSNVKLSIGGAEFPALNTEVYKRVLDSWTTRAKISGFSPQHARRLLDLLVASLLVYEEEAAVRLGVSQKLVENMVEELNLLGESWPRRELGVAKMVYRVKVSHSIEEAYKLASTAAVEAYKSLPQLRSEENSVEKVVDNLVFMDSTGAVVIAIPRDRDELVDLVSDASPIELSRGEAERLADILWDNVFSKLQAIGHALLLSPRLAKALYVSPELRYLDFISDRVERFQYTRRAYVDAKPLHVLIGVVSLLAGLKLLSKPPVQQSESTARLTLKLPGINGEVRALLYVSLGELTLTEAKKLESQLTTALLSGWRPHTILVIHYGGIEPSVTNRLEELEKRFFIKIIRIPIEALVTKVKLTVLGLKLVEAANGSVEEALELAVEAAVNPEKASKVGLDPYRLGLLFREIGDELDIAYRVRKGLEEGVDGAPLLIIDPQLGYDIEKPTELAGALRYYLVSPTSRTTAKQALTAAYEYVMRYHLYRHGGEARGLLSPDIDRREVTVLERYTTLLVSNQIVERLNGELRIDVLSPMERSVIKALEQVGARNEPIPAAVIWSSLVVNTQNPGTKRMLLQLLSYRGIIEVSSRRIDAERSRIRLILSEEEAAALIRRARDYLSHIRHSPEAKIWGYIVSAKARDYRVGTLQSFIEKAESLLATAEDSLKAGNLLMSLRLARLVLDLVDYVSQEILENHVKPVARTIARFKQEIVELYEKVRELREAAEKVLNSYVFRKRVKLSTEIEEKLNVAMKVIDEVEAIEMSEAELEEVIRKMWEEAASVAPREPGKKTPFYINGLGPKIHFNYKYWLLASHLQAIGVAKLSEDGLKVTEELSEAIRRLEEIVSEVRSAVETAAAAKMKANDLSRLLHSLGIRAPRLDVVISKIDAPKEKLSIDEAHGLVMQWKTSLMNLEKPLDQALTVTNRLVEAKRSVESKLIEAKQLASVFKEKVNLLRESMLKDYASRLFEVVRDLLAAIEQVEKLLNPPQTLEEDASLSSIVSVLEEYSDKLSSARTILSDSITMAIRASEEIEQILRRELEKTVMELQALSRLTGTKVELPRESIVDAYVAARSALEKIMKQVIEARLLSDNELKVYLIIVEEKSRKGELLLREAVEKVSERLETSTEEAKRLIISLIDRGIIEPRL